MSARSRWVSIVARIGLGFAGLLVMTVLLAAMPGHRAAVQQNPAAQGTPAQQSQEMPGMDMTDEKASEKEAVSEMTPGHHDTHSLHMTMNGDADADAPGRPEGRTGGNGTARGD